jgi:hypothetical protein
MTERYYVTFSGFNKTTILAYIYTLCIVLQRIILSLINLLRWSMGLKYYFLCVVTNKKYSVEHTSIILQKLTVAHVVYKSNFLHGIKKLNTGYSQHIISFPYLTGKIILRKFRKIFTKEKSIAKRQIRPTARNYLKGCRPWDDPVYDTELFVFFG